MKDLFAPKHEKFHALKGISFNIQQWEKVAFIWPNGAGKSTTIKAILWILHYDSWKIRIFDKDPMVEREEIAKKTASVFGQRQHVVPGMALLRGIAPPLAARTNVCLSGNDDTRLRSS